MVDLLEDDGTMFGRKVRDYAANEVQLRGSLTRLDDIERPRLVQSVSLSSATTSTALGVTVDSVTMKRNDKPKMYPVAEKLPYVVALNSRPTPAKDAPREVRRAAESAGRTQIVTATLYETGAECPNTLPESPDWVAVASGTACTRKMIGRVGLSVSPDMTQIDLGSTPNEGVSVVGVFERELVAANLGHYLERPDTTYVWTPRVCIDGECFVMTLRWGSGYLSLYNASRKQVITVGTSHGWATSMVRYDPRGSS
jgi:hypothetical protein